MKAPGFNAEKSLYRTGGLYITGGKAWSGSRMDGHILPQQIPSCTWWCDECADRTLYCPADYEPALQYVYENDCGRDCFNYTMYGVPPREECPAHICDTVDRCEPGRVSDVCEACRICGSHGPPPPSDPPPLPPPDGFCAGLVCSDGSRPISDGIHCLCPA